MAGGYEATPFFGRFSVPHLGVARINPGQTIAQRLLASCPRPVTGEDLGRIFKRSVELW